MEFFVVPSTQPIMILGTDFSDVNRCDILFSQRCVVGENLYAPIFFKNTSKDGINSIFENSFWVKFVRPCIVTKFKSKQAFPKKLYLNHAGQFSTKRNFKPYPKSKDVNENKNSNIESHIFMSQNEVTIPPNSEAIFSMKLSNVLFHKLRNKQFYFDPKPRNENSPVFIGRSLIEVSSRRIPISFINCSNSEFKLKRFTMLGKLFTLDHEFNLFPYDSSQENFVNIFSFKSEMENLSEAEMDIKVAIMKEQEPWLNEIELGALEPYQRYKIYELLVYYSQVFSKDRFDLGKTNIIEAKLQVDCEKPVFTRQYQLDAKKREILDKEIKLMKAHDIIEDSKSPFNSPLILVKKKDDSFRIVTDFRKLNKYIKDEITPLPTFSESLEILGKNKFFTSLDLCQAYLQVPLSPESRMYTAFTSGISHCQYKRLPYGLKNNTSIFQNMMNLLLGDMQYRRAMIYVDDVLIFSQTFEQHLQYLTELFDKLKSANLKLKASKCQFLKSKVTYLGHIISEEGIFPSDKKIQAVVNFPPPKNVKEVRSFVGLCSYFRRFVPDFASITYPLTHLTRPSVKFRWGTVEQECFNTLKTLLVNPPILAHPDMNKEFIVTADASSYGIGAILSQLNDNQEEQVICYYSKKLNDTQRNYSATDLELLACISALEEFRPYLYGQKFKLITDHRPIVYLQNMRNPNSRHFRYILKLQEFNFEIEHRQGVLHGTVDCLSRNPQYQDSITKFKNSKVNLMKKMLVNQEQVSEWKIKVCEELGLEFFSPDKGRVYEKSQIFDAHSFYKEICTVISNDHTQFKSIRSHIHNLLINNRKFLEKGGHFGVNKVSKYMQGIKGDDPPTSLELKAASSLLKIPIVLKNNEEDEIIFGFLESPISPFPPIGATIALEKDSLNNWSWINKDLSLPKTDVDVPNCPSRNVKKASRYNRDPGDKIVNNTSDDIDETVSLSGIKNASINVIKTHNIVEPEELTSMQQNLQKKLADTSHIRIYAVRKQQEANADHIYIPSVKELVACQDKDAFCRNWLNFFKHNTRPKFTKLFFNKHKHRYKINDDGVLTYTPKFGTRRGESAPALIVLPLNLVKFAMESLHDYMSHIGIKKTMNLASKQFYRPGLKRLISKYITACALCQNKKGMHKQRKAEVQRIPPAMDRFEIWSIDAIGSFPVTQRRNQYIISLICHFSRWIELIPVPNIKADTVADKVLIHLIARFGVPRRLHSDNGTNFTSSLIKSFCRVLKIKKTFSSALHPESNSILEKAHRFIGGALRILVSEGQKDWDVMLPHVLLAYRTTNHTSINENPAYVIYGRDLLLPTQLLPTQNTNLDNLNAHQKGAEVAIKFSAAREIYRSIMEKQTTISRENANKNRTTRDLKIGDIVLMKRPLTKEKLSSKLHKPYVGEYRIIDKIGKVNYEVQEKNGTRKFKTHIDRLIQIDPSFKEQTEHWAEETAGIFNEEEVNDEIKIDNIYVDDESDEGELALIPCSLDDFIDREYV